MLLKCQSSANCSGLDDASVGQFLANRHPQADHDQSVGLPGPALLGGELLRRCRWRLVRGQVHAGQVVAVVAVVTPTAPVLSSPPDGADGDGKDKDVDEADKGEADTETKGEP